ncbi:hypothetical protein SAMN05892883_4239 [Jatrophihabitans sp. GAS493]|uniref:hypothetical protein n=1 Tax=Jatrophihabitans sp. GAS493 TaxID=1907575 RepID=UPI000BB897A3|nr:hypothetical protein [Jatrophihabitans sp. GAS493]SOD75038.1 hypothetical protein SAMN05892883_4239 [Jatrophihabitans sp. GAS493]
MTSHPRGRAGLCVWIGCARCGANCVDAGTPHVAAAAEARAYLPDDKNDNKKNDSDNDGGCTERAEGRLCRICSNLVDCHQHGHEMTRWRPHARDDEVEWRYCQHCGGAFEDRLIALGGTR